jgi:hypothetical protein
MQDDPLIILIFQECRTCLAQYTIYQIMNYRKIFLLSISKYCVWRFKIFVILPYVAWCEVPDVLKGHIFHLQGQVEQMKLLLLDCLWFWANILHRTVSYYCWLTGKCDTHFVTQVLTTNISPNPSKENLLYNWFLCLLSSNVSWSAVTGIISSNSARKEQRCAVKFCAGIQTRMLMIIKDVLTSLYWDYAHIPGENHV